MPEQNHPGPDTPLKDWIETIAGPPPSPAGGSAAAIAAALAAALAMMVADLTCAKERYAAQHERARQVLDRAAQLRAALLELAQRDARAFERFLKARGAAKTEALRAAGVVQFELLRDSATIGDLAATIADVGAQSALGDAATAAFLAAAAARSAYWAMRADLDASSPETGAMLSDGLELMEKAEAAEWRVRQIMNERIR